MAKTDVDLALAAISADLDKITEVTTEQAGRHEALIDLVADSRDGMRRLESKVDQILILLRPTVDRLDEIDELRGRIGRIEVAVSRRGEAVT